MAAFKTDNPGCWCCGPYRFHLSSCGFGGSGARVSGVTLTFTQGSYTVSGTTDGTGYVTLTFPNTGYWNYTISFASGAAGYPYCFPSSRVYITCASGLTDAALPLNCNFPRVLSYDGSVAQAQSAFYFINSSNAVPEASSYTLTYQTRPAAIPLNLRLLYYSYPGGVSDPYYITMPDSAWFSDPVPSYLFGRPTDPVPGTPTDVYFYCWAQGCNLSVMVIDSPYGSSPYGSPADAKGAGNNVLIYSISSCDPFIAKISGAPGSPNDITGSHGADDIPCGSAGVYSNPRIGL